jgi:uncharacterized protein (UPF0297 family)
MELVGSEVARGPVSVDRIGGDVASSDGSYTYKDQRNWIRVLRRCNITSVEGEK